MKNPTPLGKWLFVSLLCNGLLAILLAIVHGYSRPVTELDHRQAALNAEALEVREEIAQLRAQKQAGETLPDDGLNWGAFPVWRFSRPQLIYNDGYPGYSTKLKPIAVEVFRMSAIEIEAIERVSASSKARLQEVHRRSFTEEENQSLGMIYKLRPPVAAVRGIEEEFSRNVADVLGEARGKAFSGAVLIGDSFLSDGRKAKDFSFRFDGPEVVFLTRFGKEPGAGLSNASYRNMGVNPSRSIPGLVEEYGYLFDIEAAFKASRKRETGL